MLLEYLHDHFVVFLLRESTDHDHAHDSFDALDANGKAATVNRVPTRTLAEHELGAERVLVPRELVVQEPGTRAPAEDRGALARDPRIVVGRRARGRCAVEEELGRVGEGDVHDGRAGCARRGDALQAGAEARAELPGDIRGEGREDAALLLRLDRGELVEGVAWVSMKFDRYA